MKKILVIIIILSSTVSCASAQTNFSMKLYAGTNASWGGSQYITIDSKGKCSYTLSEVNKGVKDSLSFTISPEQLKQLNEVINRIQFFKLDASYNSQSRDGTRLSVEVSASGKTHTVHWINIHTSETTILLEELNSILKSKGINIHY
ncbi:MAG TPA: DUF6438 domain-containing protein [Chitinophagaceae bacterium]|nr:DUF6438 domain-containing protein [Chitinophagaceae bacterium]